MISSIVVLPEARREILDAYEWYESEREGLGDELREAFRRCVSKIVERPQLNPKVTRNVRRAKLKIFPYAVFYEARRQEIVIHAFLHLHRNPRIWIRRLRKRK